MGHIWLKVLILLVCCAGRGVVVLEIRCSDICKYWMTDKPLVGAYSDFNGDGKVNFVDFAIWAKAGGGGNSTPI